MFDAGTLDEDTFGGLLLRTVSRHPSAKVFVDEHRAVTYGELGDATVELARALAAVGVGRGSRVGILMPNSPEWLASAFAVALNGAVIVPISTLATPEERDYVLQFADVGVLLTSPRSGPRDILTELAASYPSLVASRPGEAAEPRLPFLTNVFVHGLDQARGGFDTWHSLTDRAEAVGENIVAARAAAVSPNDDAIVYFTSGSTAKPKAVMHMHAGPVTTMKAMARYQKLGPGEVLLGGKQFFWVGMTSTIGACIASGAAFVGMERFDPQLGVDLIERERVTVVNCSAHQLDQMGRAALTGDRDLSSLRIVEPSRLAEAAGLPEDHEYLVGYGMTETAGVAASLPSDSPAVLKTSTNGKTHDRIEIRIVDPETGIPVPVGEPGIVQLKGAPVMRGYLKQPRDVGFSGGYLVTEDLGRLDADGYFHYLGRTNGVIKTNGANVSREEVEAVARGWGGLDGAYVVGVPHPTMGEAVVLVAVGDERTFDPTALEKHMRGGIAAFKLPKLVLFQDGDAIPRTKASDKVDYPRLAEHVRESIIRSDGAEWASFLSTR